MGTGWDLADGIKQPQSAHPFVIISIPQQSYWVRRLLVGKDYWWGLHVPGLEPMARGWDCMSRGWDCMSRDWKARDGIAYMYYYSWYQSHIYIVLYGLSLNILFTL